MAEERRRRGGAVRHQQPASDTDPGDEFARHDDAEMRELADTRDAERRTTADTRDSEMRERSEMRDSEGRTTADTRDSEMRERPMRDTERREMADTRDTDMEDMPETRDAELPRRFDERPMRLLSEEDNDRLGERWERLQTQFVDRPRETVTEADRLVADVMQQISSEFLRARQRLEEQWGRGDDVSTEDLRQALQRYRSFFHQLLTF